MKRILYYISGHGYGHLTRSLALVQALHRSDPSIFFTLKCHENLKNFARNYLNCYGISINIQSFNSTFNYVFDGKMDLDIYASAQNINKWVESLQNSAEHERYTTGRDCSLVLSDIAPEAFWVANHLGIPSIAISNFTWYEVCAEYVPDSAVNLLRNMYEMANEFVEYPLSTGNKIPLRNRHKVGLISRPFDFVEANAIRQKYKKKGRPLMLFSVGGALKIQEIQLSYDIDYLYTQGISLPPASNLHPISPNQLNIQDCIAACDGVITKFGWSTFAESIIAQKPIFFLRSDGGWAEEKLVLDEVMTLPVIEQIRPDMLKEMQAEETIDKLTRLKEGYKLLPTRYNDDIKSVIKLIKGYL